MLQDCCIFIRLGMKASSSRITPDTLLECFYAFLWAGQIWVSWFVFRTQRAVYNTVDDMLALANSYVLACVVAL